MEAKDAGSQVETILLQPEYEVKLEAHEQPKRMSKLRKWTILLTAASVTGVQGTVNSGWGIISDQVRVHYHSSEEEAILGIALFVLALAIGPLILSPLSEHYGRRPIYRIAAAGFLVCQIITCFVHNLNAMVAFRFFTGIFATGIISNASGTVADIFGASEQMIPMNVVSFAAIASPGGTAALGYIAQYFGFEWVLYAMLIMSAVVCIPLVFVQETYTPALLRKKWKSLHDTDGRYHLAYPVEQHRILDIVTYNCKRPIKLLICEPIVMLMSLYTGYLIGIVYIFFIVFPTVFGQIYGMSLGQVGLTYLSIPIGMGSAMLTAVFWDKRRERKIKAQGVQYPEMHMDQALCGGIIVPIGLIIFAWTVYPSIHWIVPLIGSVIMNFGVDWSFAALLTYLVESFPEYAVSVTGANTFVRCVMAFGFTMASRPWTQSLGNHWTITSLAVLGAVSAPCGWILGKYGRGMRERDKKISY